MDSQISEERMDCAECGQNVAIKERHTFVDCARYAAEEHLIPVAGKYARALVREIDRLREREKALEEALRAVEDFGEYWVDGSRG